MAQSALPSPVKRPVDAEDFEPAEVEGEFGSFVWLNKPDGYPNELPAAAIWRILPGEGPTEFPYTFECNELMHVLEGRLDIEVKDGETISLGPGDAAFVAKGTESVWRLTLPLKKLFMMSD